MGKLDQIERRIEAMLFASGDPLEIEKISEILDIEPPTVINLVEHIKCRYASQNSPISIVKLSESYQMTTLPEFANDIRAALEVRKSIGLSQASLEVLAVIAYNQPVTRAFVEQVRGVDCSSIVRGLSEKDLITESGRMNIPGKPIVYKTTANFLRCFGLESLEKLPTLPDTPPEDLNTTEEQVEGQIDFFE